MRPAPLLAAVAVACLATAGCGYAAPSEAGKVRATAETFVHSCATGRPERASQVLTEPLRATFHDRGSTARACAGFLGIAPAGMTDADLSHRLGRLSVGGLTLHGDAAEVTLSPAGGAAKLGLAKTAGEWLIDSAPSGA